MGPCFLWMISQLHMTLLSVFSVIPVGKSYMLGSAFSVVRTSDCAFRSKPKG